MVIEGITFGETLKSCQGLSTISLLDTDVYIVLAGTDVFAVTKWVAFVCEWICVD